MSSVRFSYLIFLFSLVFGVVFYDYISNVFHFTYIDELIALALLISYYEKVMITRHLNKEFLIVIIIILFYLVYSFYIHTNVTPAIWMDFLIFSKPFVAFYCFYEMAPQFTEKQKKIICRLCYILAFIPLFIGVIERSAIYTFFVHPSRLATTSTIIAATYLFCSERNKKDIQKFIIILAIGLLSFKSKQYVFFVSALGIVCFLKDIKLKTIIPALLVLLPLMAWAGWGKFDFYYVQGTVSENIFARPALFMGAWDLLHTYFPFGSGFGSYASYAAAVYLSPLYYGIPILRLSSEIQDGMFLCDSFFPQLAQFGVVGTLLFFYFWYIQLRKGYINYLQSHNILAMKMILLTAIFFFVESIPDTTFTHNRGMFMMMLLALWIKETEQKSYENSYR